MIHKVDDIGLFNDGANPLKGEEWDVKSFPPTCEQNHFDSLIFFRKSGGPAGIC